MRRVEKKKGRLKRAVQRWLGITELYDFAEGLEVDIQELRKGVRKVVEAVRDVEDGAVLGVDLGYRDLSSIILIKYSKITNGFQVIADTKARFETYHQFVNDIRKLADKYNVSEVTIDSPPDIKVDLKARILPDKALTDIYRGMDNIVRRFKNLAEM